MTIVAARMKVEIGADISGAQQGMATVDKGLKQIGDVGKFALGTVLGNAITGAGRQLLGLGGEALSAYAEFERMGASLNQLSARELLNAGGAKTMGDALQQTQGRTQELLGWVQKLAIQSPFTNEGIMTSLRTGMAFGFTTSQAQRLTKALVDFSAGSGATTETMNRVALSLGQIQARGKLSGEEVRELAMAGLPVKQILADAFGVTTAELEKMQTQGLIPADRAIEAIVSSLENDFGGAAQRQSGTIAGLVSSLEDLKSVGLREFFGPVFKEFQPDLDRFVQSLQDPRTIEQIRQMGTEFAKSIRDMVTVGQELITWFQGLQGGTQGAAVAIGILALNAGNAIKLMTGLYAVTTNLPALVSGISTAWKAWNAGLTLTTSLQAGFGTMAVTLGAIAIAAVAVTAAWIAWNENIVKTNAEGSKATGNVMSKFLSDARASGADAAKLTEEFGAAYGRMNDQINRGGVASAFVDRQQLARESLTALSTELISMGVNYDEYNQRMMMAAQATGELSNHQARMILSSGNQAQIAAFLSQRLGILGQAEFNAARATQANAQAMNNFTAPGLRAFQTMNANTGSFLQQGQAAKFTSDNLEGVYQEYNKLNNATAAFNQNFGDKVAQKLEQAGIKGEKLTNALGTIDNKFGSNTLAAYNANKALDDAIANYKKTGDIKAFDDALGANRDQWAKIDEGIKTAQTDWNNFITGIAQANGMKIAIYVDTIVSGSGGTGPGSKSVEHSTGNKDTATASGGPRWAGQTLLVGEQGPELYIPRQDGYFANGATTQQMLDALLQIAQNVGRSPTAASPLQPIIQLIGSGYTERDARKLGNLLATLQR